MPNLFSPLGYSIITPHTLKIVSCIYVYMYVILWLMVAWDFLDPFYCHIRPWGGFELDKFWLILCIEWLCNEKHTYAHLCWELCTCVLWVCCLLKWTQFCPNVMLKSVMMSYRPLRSSLVKFVKGKLGFTVKKTLTLVLQTIWGVLLHLSGSHRY